MQCVPLSQWLCLSFRKYSNPLYIQLHTDTLAQYASATDHLILSQRQCSFLTLKPPAIVFIVQNEMEPTFADAGGIEILRAWGYLR